MILSAKYLEFHIRFMILVPYVHDNAERLHLPESFIELLDEHWDNWEEEFNGYISPITQHLSDISNEYTTCFEFLAGLRTRLKGDTTLQLNAADKAYLEINDKTKSVGKIPVTDFSPSLACIFQTHLMIRFFAFDPKHPHKKKKPEGAGFIGIMIAYTNQGEPTPAQDDYRTLLPEKKSIFEISYPADKAKMILYIKVYYISPTGEAGKASRAIMVELY